MDWSLTALENATGGLWPYLVIAIFGFLPTEVWRSLGVFVGKGLDEHSEVFHWVRMVATALVTAVVAKLLLSPQGALASIPLWGRAGPVLVGIAVMLVAKRSIMWGLVAGGTGADRRRVSLDGGKAVSTSRPWTRFWHDFSRQAAMQGILVAIVGYASSVAIVVQGLKAMGATSTQIASGLFFLGLGKGLVAIGLSLWTAHADLDCLDDTRAGVACGHAHGRGAGLPLRSVPLSFQVP